MFRPLPILTLFSLPALVLLIGLGGWQWSRMGEKANAIAAWESQEAGEAVPLEFALCEARAGYFGREIIRPDDPGHTFIRFQGRSVDGEPGWRHMYALALPACFSPGAGQAVLVQYGFEPLRGGDVAVAGRLTIVRPPASGAFAAANEIASRTFYRFEASDLTEALGGMPIYPDFWIVAYSGEMPPQLASVPPSQHLGYALTWWGMALALIAVYLVLHVQRGRLRFTRR
ncbi:SURF1 family protein [Hyphobacterium sp.]|uniref:SURF1 family protein n=1 Tax=Hyphobacterium sp. TaxID=2004662 RepID=UPI003BAB7FFA